MYGVLYEFDTQEKANLDALEGSGKACCEQLVQFSMNGETYTLYIYVAQSTHIDPTLVPYHWYKNLVLAGARYHNFPAQYVVAIEAIPPMDDPGVKLTQDSENLLRQMGQV